MRTRHVRLLLPIVLTSVATLLVGCAGGDDRSGTNNKDVRAAAEAAGVTNPGSIVAFGESAEFIFGEGTTGKFSVSFEKPEAGDPAWFEGINLATDHLDKGGSIVIARYTITAVDDAASQVTDSSFGGVAVRSADGERSSSQLKVGERGVDECLLHDRYQKLDVGESAEGCVTWLYDGAPGELPAAVGVRGTGDFKIYDEVYWDAGE